MVTVARLPWQRWAVAGATAESGEGTHRVSVLDDILVGVRADLAERQARVSLDELKAKAERPPGRRNPSPCCAATASRSSPR